MAWLDGRRYRGQWRQGQMSGKGRLESGGAVYEGDLRQGLRDGFGLQTWPDGSSFAGEWKEGLQHGEGVLQEGTGAPKRGYWAAGRRLKWLE